MSPGRTRIAHAVAQGAQYVSENDLSARKPTGIGSGSDRPNHPRRYKASGKSARNVMAAAGMPPHNAETWRLRGRVSALCSRPLRVDACRRNNPIIAILQLARVRRSRYERGGINRRCHTTRR